jgi:CRP/FNR family transcriptional regulator, dissimilatory nitrate respiration regulator
MIYVIRVRHKFKHLLVYGGTLTFDNSSLQGALTEVAAFPLFKGLSRDNIQKLCEAGELRVNKHRDILFEHSEKANKFAVVLSGAYKLSRMNPLGEDTVIHFSAPGDVIAALVMPQPEPLYPVTARAMGPSRALLIKREVYLKSWLAAPELIMRVQGLLSTRMSRFQNQKVMQRAPLQSKVASLLMQLVAKNKEGQEIEIPLPLTRREIADSLGVTVESVIRVMSDWAKRGIISTSEQYIRIHRPESLVNSIHEAGE